MFNLISNFHPTFWGKLQNFGACPKNFGACLKILRCASVSRLQRSKVDFDVIFGIYAKNDAEPSRNYQNRS